MSGLLQRLKGDEEVQQTTDLHFLLVKHKDLYYTC